ncbi:HdeD family acid-resistance protein [Fundicoccus culcitae]|uniref:DUF308 domain-containing protein n=1 Tax=Fundicoccus culcitae TaxID=2969821 RepID=A0ABY5P2M8_9LACT|nr:DUF308 domain-containing protein [Fundicoccus culcitae]UUX32819.1 DUF308 domain-containing protein [Fundicoccus culcitae]
MFKTRESKWGNIIMGILMLVLAVLTYRNPLATVASIVVILAVGAIIKGLFEITTRRNLAKSIGAPTWPMWLIGIIDIIVGIYLLMNAGLGVAAMPFAFAIWFIVDSIGAIGTSFMIRRVSNSNFWLTLILGIIGLIVGIALLYNPASAAVTVVNLLIIYFVIAAIGHFIAAFTK